MFEDTKFEGVERLLTVEYAENGVIPVDVYISAVSILGSDSVDSFINRLEESYYE